MPPVLLSGDHADIRRWRLEQAFTRTLERRPELLARQDSRPRRGAHWTSFWPHVRPVTKIEVSAV